MTDRLSTDVRDDVVAPAQPRRHMARYDLTGLAFAVLFFALSMTPSLIPRGWLLQGIVSGILSAAGYGLGLVAGNIVGALLPRPPRSSLRAGARRALAVGGPLVVIASLYLGARWQHDVHAAVGMEQPLPSSFLGTIATTTILFVTLVGAARGVRWLTGSVARRFDRWVPRPIASIVAGLAVSLLLLGVLDGVVLRALVGLADGASKRLDEALTEDVRPPRSHVRSGGPASLVSWEQLGSKGRDFVAGGPTVDELAEFHSRSADEPIRVYVGLPAGEDDNERVAVAIRELEHMGAFDRAVLCIVLPTGTGWVNSIPVDALEYLYNGDTAMVAVQYSYLPSWLSFLVDTPRARDAGRELINDVHDRWSQLPPDQRPLLLVFGESLGSHAVEAAFSGTADIGNRIDGALLTGPTNFNELWREFTHKRDPGSLQRLPTFDGENLVRFAAGPEDLIEAQRSSPPRLVYLQHASDPVVWWTPELILRQPDWLREPRGDDVLPRFRWYPLVTFLQLSVDLVHATDVPAGYGHRYGDTAVDAWTAILRPPGWDNGDNARLKRTLRHGRHSVEEGP